MIAVSSSDFIKEFTIYAERANDEPETFVVQRANDKNLVGMSMETYNGLMKQIYKNKE